jgi:hypothetical protein
MQAAEQDGQGASADGESADPVNVEHVRARVSSLCP